METRHMNPDMNRDDMQRPDRAKHDELGRTTQGGRSEKASPREQPAKAVHPDREGAHDRFGKSTWAGSEKGPSNRGNQQTNEPEQAEFEDEEIDTDESSHRSKR